MPIETSLPGNPESVYTAADWLRTLAEELKNGKASLRLARLLTTSGGWTGEAAHSYTIIADKIVKATAQLQQQTNKARDIVEAYAQQLGFRQADMADLRGRATEGGLIVTGTIIHEPPTPTTPLPPTPRMDTIPVPAEHFQAHAEHLPVQLYKRLEQLATDNRERLTRFITTELHPLIEQLAQPNNLDEFPDEIGVASIATDITATATKNGLLAHSDALLAAGYTIARNRAQSRSGNPAIRNGTLPPIHNIDKHAGRGKPAELITAAKHVAGPAKMIGRAAPATAVGFAGIEIAGGASPSSIAVETVGAFGGAMALGPAIGTGVGLAAAAASSPAWVGPVAAGVLIVAISAGVGSAAGWAYKSWVPVTVRRQIDEGLTKVIDWHGDATSALGR